MGESSVLAFASRTLVGVCVGAAAAFAQPAPPSPQTPAPPPAGQADAAKPDPMAPPRLPPFAGTLVSFDRRGERVVACVDRSTVPMRPAAPGAPAPPPTPKLPPAYRIWLIEREVMQELMTTGGLCSPAWSPDGKSFLAAGVRGLFAFTEPQYEARVLMLLTPPTPPAAPTMSGAAPPPAAPAPATVKTTEPGPVPFSHLSWSPSGRRVAFLLTRDGAVSLRVVDAKDGTVVFTRDGRAATVQWGADDRTLVVDGARLSLP